MPRRNSGPRIRFLAKRGVYYIVWTESGRSRERSTGTTDREEAEIKLAEFIHGRAKTEGPKKPSQLLVTDALADYLEERAPEIADPDRLAIAVEFLTPYWAEKTVAEVNTVTCRAYRRARQRSNGTVRRELGVLRASLNHAHRAGRLTQIVPVDLPPSAPSRDRWLTRKEAASLLKASLGMHKSRLYLPLFILIALYTGQRKEAVLSLRWSQVDLQGGRINFNPPGRRQTNKRRPTTRIARRLMPHLKRARLRGSDIGYVVNRNGQRLSDIKKSFAAACAKANIQDASPHTLRHTCATWLMQRGVDKWEVSGYLGMTLETLERVYGHHHPEYQKSAAEAF